MNVQCEKCGTRYNLDDTKVKPGETKVRCSQCQHVFTVPHPLTLNEEEIFSETDAKVEDAFMKEWAQEIASQPPQAPEQSAPSALDEGPPPRAFVPPTTEEPLLREETPSENVPVEEAPVAVEEAPVEEAPIEKELVAEPVSPGEEIFPVSPVPVEEVPPKTKRKISTAFLLTLVLLLIVGGSLYYWSRMGRSIPAFEYIYEKIYTLMEGKKEQKLFLLYLKGSEHILEGNKVFVIQGKVANRSQETKKFVKVQASLFDKTGKVVATSTGFCGVTITNEKIKNSTYESLKASFGFIAPGRALPVPSQQSLPFTIIFFSPPGGASQYQAEIAEAGESV
jgi:predicted Zn finger-like uncharacterized protein